MPARSPPICASRSHGARSPQDFPPKFRSRSTAAALLDLDSIAADVRLRADANDGVAALCVSVGGDGRSATHLGCVTARDGVEAAVRLLDVLAQRGRDARIARHCRGGGRRGVPLRCRRSDRRMMEPAPICNGEFSGCRSACIRLRDETFAYGVGLAFGHADATSLQRLTEAAKAAGASGMRAAPGRALHDRRPYATDSLVICRRRRSARLYRACRRSAAACGCLRWRADLRLGDTSPRAPLRRKSPRPPRRIATARSRFIFRAAPRAARILRRQR